jgi:ABC-type lipoprotein release transport system permease subunit
VRVSTVEFALVAVAAMLLALLATVPPSLIAARMRPADGLRFD